MCVLVNLYVERTIFQLILPQYHSKVDAVRLAVSVSETCSEPVFFALNVLTTYVRHLNGSSNIATYLSVFLKNKLKQFLYLSSKTRICPV